MKTFSFCLGKSCWAAVIGLALLANPAMAVDDLGLFELDGNASDPILPNGGPNLPDDWETLYNGGTNDGGSADPFTGINPDPAPNTIFDGGKKDIQDISAWSGKNGSVPDKDDITNAYAAAYECPAGQGAKCNEGDLIVYFGADRITNVGDAFIGFWFFKDDVSFDPVTGQFSGDHVNGDTLVLANFPQANNAVPDVKVVQWDSTCSKAASNNPTPGQCAAKNLRLVAGASGAGAVCGTAINDMFCAITNAEGGPNDPTNAPWPYTFKDGSTGSFPYETFFEGGINLTALTGEACFASFMAETRSSSSFTASLKDFRLDQFPLCSVELSKDCGTGTYDPESGDLLIPYSVTVTNTGGGSVQEVIATDDDCGFGDGTTLNFGPLASGESETQDGECLIPAGEDLSGGITNGVSAIADGGDTVVTLAESCASGTDPDSCYSACSFNLSPAIGVTKRCRTQLLAEDGVVKVNVEFAGDVTNTSDTMDFPVPLAMVSVFDNKVDGLLELYDADSNLLGTMISLDPGEKAFFKNSYLPDGNGDSFSECPADATFSDTVTASGVDVFEGTSVEDMATAECELCTADNCDPL